MFKRHFTYVAALGLLAATSICFAKDQAAKDKPAAESKSTTHSAAEIKSGTKILSSMHRMNLAEIEMGHLAQDQGRAQSVKDYGEMLVDYHQKSEEQVKEIADEMKITLLDEDEATAGKEKDKITKLKNTKGPAFDREFAKCMVEDHTKAISTLEADQKEATGRVAELVAQTLPMLKQHQAAAQKLVGDLASAKSPK